MVALVTTEEARVHLRLTTTDMDDPDIAATVQSKALGASEIVIDYLKNPDHGWTDTTAPALVKAGTLLVLGALFDDREGGDPMSDAVKDVLHRYRDPALA